MNVISLKTSTSGTIYTCPAGTVVEVEMVWVSDGAGTLNINVSGIFDREWLQGNISFQVSALNGSANGIAAGGNDVFTDSASTGLLRPSKIKLGPGDSLYMTTARSCSLIIYEETTGTH
ncbi:hypothetical protein [Nitrosomonas sp.]|uniref:hypothetical protein n=1 Tax=Nitrosomonas sp. TaxID=42353 RepID=UPI0025E2644F|nr:hypothetical protein [Nitrosomonas sp.]MBV6447295.1 hypothetical protein [Nitrosomonas sp.]